MGQQLWGPALDAEVAYRYERLAEASRGVGAVPALRRALRERARARREARRQARRARRRSPRAAGSGLGATLDAVAARTDAAAWDAQVTRRAVPGPDATAPVRPRDDAGRRAA